jgi:hypothetical protein
LARKVSFIKKDIGVIAQEIQKLLFQVVHKNADGYLSVAYENLVGILIESRKTFKQTN